MNESTVCTHVTRRVTLVTNPVISHVTRRVTRVQTVDSFMTYRWVCNKSNTTGDTCTDSGLIHDLSLGL
jgi:hypothetical protein